MAESSSFEHPYSDLEHSEPESDSDFDPRDVDKGSDTESGPIDGGDDERSGAPSTSELPPGPLAAKIFKILAVIQGNGLTVAEFLDALSWGDRECTLDATVRAARTALCNSPLLPGILRRWHRPPRPPNSRKARPQGARSVMEHFALECSQEILERELEELADIFESPFGDDISEEELTSLSFPQTVKLVKLKAPNLWDILFRLSRTQGQQTRNPHKNPSNTILIVLAMFSYTRTHHRGKLQKLFAVYFKFRGLSAKGFDTLHAIGLTMSNKWTGDAVDRISEEGMKVMKRLMELYPWIMSYDNALVAFRVFSQRIDRKGSQGSGTAGTVYIKRGAKPLPPNINRMLQEWRRDGAKNPISGVDIFKISLAADKRRIPHLRFLVLHYLFHSEPFDFDTYSGRDHDLLKEPAALCQLPCGKNDITLQYLLGTLNIPEASYEDNSRLIIEWLKQLGYSDDHAQKKLGLEQVMAWVGDQLTVDRLRNLFRFRAEDDNSFERLDWLLFPPGWLHIQMAFANSIHKQHLGTAKGRGLSAAFDILKRRGLQTQRTQGTFFHDLDETLHIIVEAQIRELWMHVGKTTDLQDLRQKTPAELVKLADEILGSHASSAALVQMRVKPQNDEVKTQSIMFLRDTLPYILLRSAVKHGDVGLMEDMIPLMLFRFIGGKNNNYSGEMFELLQGFHREWPPEICDFIRNDCWVINNTTQRSAFMAVDEAQEMNIKDIKVTYRSEGPSIDWDYLKKLHPAIHVIRAVNKHMESEFKTQIRGKKHTVPKKEQDIRELQQWYRASDVHKYKPGRKIPTALKKNPDLPKDVLSWGGIALQTGKTSQRWIEARSVDRATSEDWDDLLLDAD
ncbi:hypothetical protein R3P38DRAFT_2644943 [Favolaschia claudopus]|uniref:DUF6589 domain-containing protein n=1 Tax=Favolaschia claudopus TaxID=2862362 RepID=A0AAW0AGP5_9AGAR